MYLRSNLSNQRLRALRALRIPNLLQLFIHVSTSRKLELHGMHTVGGLAVVVGDVAALEASIEHGAEFAVAHDDVAAAHRSIARGQLAPSRVPRLNSGSTPANRLGNLARDRVRIPQQRLAVRGAQAPRAPSAMRS